MGALPTAAALIAAIALSALMGARRARGRAGVEAGEGGGGANAGPVAMAASWSCVAFAVVTAARVVPDAYATAVVTSGRLRGAGVPVAQSTAEILAAAAAVGVIVVASSVRRALALRRGELAPGPLLATASLCAALALLSARLVADTDRAGAEGSALGAVYFAYPLVALVHAVWLAVVATLALRRLARGA